MVVGSNKQGDRRALRPVALDAGGYRGGRGAGFYAFAIAHKVRMRGDA